jgi:hypothetical protein
MLSGTVSMSEIAAAGGILDARYYLGRRQGETYAQWRERSELEIWAVNRIALLERWLGNGPTGLGARAAGTALGKLKRELYMNELALLRMRALREDS